MEDKFQACFLRIATPFPLNRASRSSTLACCRSGIAFRYTACVNSAL